MIRIILGTILFLLGNYIIIYALMYNNDTVAAQNFRLMQKKPLYIFVTFGASPILIFIYLFNLIKRK